ncbi:LexA/Signal peptidase [Nadsonia fulvescens var. elongata DSM 6958]|uniref:LexA/Signal peptidase n=1 Tax=Nadsonia fulvescens var. elongata DSM 6958 TaxID=857566 RepID=A0A1E3PKE0_9ASCO|nr:LexA/Signal peptidase [Nadsonia fulvescens var. elongata DSM 6958]
MTSKNFLAFPLRTFSISVRLAFAIHFVHTHFYEVTLTQGESMLPTLRVSGDWVHADKQFRRGRNCQVGDVIVAVKPTDPEQRVCKRITGMEGDLIMVDGTVEHGDEKFIRVPKGHCWVTGDNLSSSLDSRSYGALPLALIKGKIIAKTGGDKWFERIENNLVDAKE